MGRFPNPYETNDDLSHATVFLVVLFLLAGVGAILFLGDAWKAPLESTKTALAAIQPLVGQVAGRTAVADSTGPTAGLSPRGTATPTPAALVSSSGAFDAPKAAATPAAKPTSTPAPAPATATPTPQAPRRAVVANTDGAGVYLRRTPQMADKLVPWPDNTPLDLLGEQSNNEGIRWEKVRDPRGTIGWVPAQYIRPTSP
jgi:hypothetical protein